jgi:hypothetical protein
MWAFVLYQALHQQLTRVHRSQQDNLHTRQGRCRSFSFGHCLTGWGWGGVGGVGGVSTACFSIVAQAHLPDNSGLIFFVMANVLALPACRLDATSLAAVQACRQAGCEGGARAPVTVTGTCSREPMLVQHLSKAATWHLQSRQFACT